MGIKKPEIGDYGIDIAPDTDDLLGHDKITMVYDEKSKSIISYGKNLANLMDILGFYQMNTFTNMSEDFGGYSFILYENYKGDSALVRYKLKMGAVSRKVPNNNKEIVILMPIMQIDPILPISSKDYPNYELDLKFILDILKSKNQTEEVSAYFESTLVEILHELFGKNPFAL